MIIAYWTLVALVAQTALIVLVIVRVKAGRRLKEAWHEEYYRRLRPALDRYLDTQEPQREISRLRGWQKDRFLAPLIVDRLMLLTGAEREDIIRLAHDSGLIDIYLRAVSSSRRWRRARGAEYLGYLGGADAAYPVSALLSDDNETVRAVAARALARIGTKEAVGMLFPKLDAASEITRLRVAENLERVGHLAVEPLLALLKDVDLRETHEAGIVMAAKVLGNLHAEDARKVLRTAAIDSASVNVRAQATLALGKIGNPEDLLIVIDRTHDPEWCVRGQAANALGMMGDASAIPSLRALASDRSWWVRRNATFSLAKTGPAGEAALVSLLETGDRFARRRAVATMEALGITRRAVRNLSKPGPSGNRSREIVGNVCRALDSRYLKNLSKTLDDDENRAVLRGIIDAENAEDQKVVNLHNPSARRLG